MGRRETQELLELQESQARMVPLVLPAPLVTRPLASLLSVLSAVIQGFEYVLVVQVHLSSSS